MTQAALGFGDKMRMALLAIASFLVLLVPLGMNGAPVFWLGDSTAYLHGGSTAWSYVTGQQTRFAEMEKSEPAQAEASSSAGASEASGPASAGGNGSYQFSNARSPYYAVMIVVATETLGPNGAVLLQALLMALTVTFLVKAIFGRNLLLPAILCIGGIGLSTAGFFTTVVLPDFLAPIGLVAASVLLALWPRLSKLDIVFWFAMLVLSLIAHSTHLAMILLVAVLAIGLQRVFLGRFGVAGLVCVFAAIVVALVAGSVSKSLIAERYGYTPRSLPMVAASLLTQGPAKAYLHQTCPDNGFVYCAFRDNRATEVDVFMWSTQEGLGVFQRADAETRLTMSDQQWAFLAEVLKFDFWGQVKATLNKIWRQLSDNSITQFRYNASDRAELQQLPEPDRQAVTGSAIYRDTLELGTISRISQWICWLSAAALATLVARNLRVQRVKQPATPDTDAPLPWLALFTMLIVLGILINASLTGAASQPQGRYSARLFLLFPFLLSLWVAWTWRNASEVSDRVISNGRAPT